MNRDQALGYAIKALTTSVNSAKEGPAEDYQAHLHFAAEWAQIVIALRAVA